MLQSISTPRPSPIRIMSAAGPWSINHFFSVGFQNFFVDKTYPSPSAQEKKSLQRPGGQRHVDEYYVIRYIYVIFKMATPTPSDPAVEPAPAADMDKLKIAEEASPAQVPPHKSHDPANNMKRSDPFQFGSRYLTEGDNVYEFNAWDHVETDDAYKEYTEQQLEKQRQAPVSDFDKSKLPHNVLFVFTIPVVMISKQHSSELSDEIMLIIVFRSHLNTLTITLFALQLAYRSTS